MKQEKLSGNIQTVLGLIDPENLGITLSHEHLLADISSFRTEPAEASQRKIAHEPVRIDNLYWVRFHFLNHEDDLKLTDEETVIKEAMIYKLAGGKSIVEMTCNGKCRDPLGLSRISRATGLNVIMGCGYYLAPSHPPTLAKRTDEDIAEELVQEIMVGVGNTGIRAGIIGEIGCSGLGAQETERKVLRAAAMAQQRTGVAINVHPSIGYFDEKPVLEEIKILEDAGADLRRVVISHVCAYRFSPSLLRKIADKGCYLEYDAFGHYWLPPFGGRYYDMPTDTQRVDMIKRLIAEGYLNQILVSQDIILKHYLVAYGGHGYAHILRDIVPMMRGKGMTEEQIHTLLVDNPKRILTIA